MEKIVKELMDKFHTIIFDLYRKYKDDESITKDIYKIYHLFDDLRIYLNEKELKKCSRYFE